jgi:hypothetical protein
VPVAIEASFANLELNPSAWLKFGGQARSGAAGLPERLRRRELECKSTQSTLVYGLQGYFATGGGSRRDPFTITNAHGRYDRPSDALVLNRNAQLRDFLTRGFSMPLQEQLGTSGNSLNQKTARPDISRPRSVVESPFISRQ